MHFGPLQGGGRKTSRPTGPTDAQASPAERPAIQLIPLHPACYWHWRPSLWAGAAGTSGSERGIRRTKRRATRVVRETLKAQCLKGFGAAFSRAKTRTKTYPTGKDQDMRPTGRPGVAPRLAVLLRSCAALEQGRATRRPESPRATSTTSTVGQPGRPGDPPAGPIRGHAVVERIEIRGWQAPSTRLPTLVTGRHRGALQRLLTPEAQLSLTGSMAGSGVWCMFRTEGSLGHGSRDAGESWTLDQG
jgi:hypothetical protein